MNEKVQYSISIDNQHCIDCPNLKNMLETAQNMQLVLDCPWTRIVVLESGKYATRHLKHVRIDFSLHPGHSNYQYLIPSDNVLIWDFTSYAISESIKKNIRESVRYWM